MNSEPTGLVTYRLDPDNPPVLTAEERKAWKRLKEMRDEEIDLSDIPELTTGWRRVSELGSGGEQAADHAAAGCRCD